MHQIVNTHSPGGESPPAASDILARSSFQWLRASLEDWQVVNTYVKRASSKICVKLGCNQQILIFFPPVMLTKSLDDLGL
jgi:hypothetical protein